MALESKPDEAVEQLGVRDPARGEQLPVDARRGEARDRVELVDDDAVVLVDEEVDARHPLAVRRDEGLDGEPPHLGRRRLGDARRDPTAPSRRRRTSPRSRTSRRSPRSRRRPRRSARGSRARRTRPRSPAGTPRRAPCRRDGGRGRPRSSSSAVRPRLGDADGRAEPGGLDEHRVAVRVLDGIARAQRHVARDRDAAVAQHGLEQVLVHAERRRGDARADVRDACQLQQPLHRPVLAERAVQDGQDDVHLAERRGGAVGGHREGGSGPGADRGRRGRRERPPTVAADLDHGRLVAGGIERLDHRGGRGERDLVLARAASGEHGDAEARSRERRCRVRRRRRVGDGGGT